MKRAKCGLGALAAAFGLGVLAALILPSDFMLVITLVVLILPALCGSIRVRG